MKKKSILKSKIILLIILTLLTFCNCDAPRFTSDSICTYGFDDVLFIIEYRAFKVSTLGNERYFKVLNKEKFETYIKENQYYVKESKFLDDDSMKCWVFFYENNYFTINEVATEKKTYFLQPSILRIFLKEYDYLDYDKLYEISFPLVTNYNLYLKNGNEIENEQSFEYLKEFYQIFGEEITIDEDKQIIYVKPHIDHKLSDSKIVEVKYNEDKIEINIIDVQQ
jgi:hypothetical protein